MPSLKKRIAARVSLKRVIRHRMGLKVPRGLGILTNPKRAIYNKIYRKTSLGIGDITRLGKAKTKQPEQPIQVSTGSVNPITTTNFPVLDKHFELSENIPLYYKNREVEGLEKTIEACRQQIELACQAKAAFLEKYPWQPLPSHRGYEQLAIILGKQGKHGEAIQVCEQAKGEGWSGDWDTRIERYKGKP